MRFWVVTGSPFTSKEPAAPGSPPKIPWGGSVRRLVTALSSQGLLVSTLNSIVWPRPPIWVPKPPEP